MIDVFHVHTFTVRKAASLITADIYMPSIDKKGSVKTMTSGLKIDSLLVASSDLKLTRPLKVEVCFY